MSDNIFLFMGIQGSGKGTQSQFLSEACQIPQISTGDLFRATMKQPGELGERLRAILNAGDLVPDELTSEMARERLMQADAQRGFILDGYPRTAGQVQHLDDMLKEWGKSISAVFYFDLPESETVARLEPRRVCTKDQTHIYHLINNPPKQEGSCDVDGAPLKQRDDDKPDAIRKRVAEYQAQTLPLLDLYRERGLVHRINALDTIASVRGQVMDVAGCK